MVTFARRRLLQQVRSAKDRIWLVSPYISAPVAASICTAAAESRASDRRLLTALDARSVQCGVLDPSALSLLRDSEFEIASIDNLHAKFMLVDSAWGLIGSGNLTGAGMGGEDGGGNYEMGVLLTSGQVEVASKIVAGWWSLAGSVSADQIAEYASLPKFPKSPLGSVGPTIVPPQTAGLEEVLAEDAETAASRRYWINPNYHNPNDEKWWSREWVSDAGNRSYGKGDLLVIYLGKTNGGPQLCPAVLSVTETCRYDPEFVIEHRDAEAAGKWPYVTKASVIAGVSPWEGVPLEMAGKTHLSVENGCELTRREFEKIAWAMLG